MIRYAFGAMQPGLSTNCHACPFLSKLSDQTESMQILFLPSHIVIHLIAVFKRTVIHLIAVIQFHLHRDTWRIIPYSRGTLGMTAFWMFRMRFPRLQVMDLHRISCGRQLPKARWQGNRWCLGRGGSVNCWKMLELVSILRFVRWKSVILLLTESHLLNS